ncbi:MAG: hypothetical protein JSV80_18430 [Acidobacteriota bacterium]|nr:MAG: hypothetical protein JSV80_18430 [Acidobacteriota bacterium]
MITPRLRPRLELTVPLALGDVAARVEAQLRQPDSPCVGLVTEDQIELRVRSAERRFWSPQLVVRVTSSDGSCELKGHFGPDAQVWSLFLATYAFIVLCALFGFFYGVAQLMIEQPPVALWSVPLAVVLIVLIYVAAGVGQRLGSHQAEILHAFLVESVAPQGQRRPSP